MDVIVERYAKWWERRCAGMVAWPGKIVYERLRAFPMPRTVAQVLEHIDVVGGAIAEFQEERPALIWPGRLIEELRGWHRVFVSEESIRGLTVDEAVDAVMLGESVDQVVGRINHG